MYSLGEMLGRLGTFSEEEVIVCSPEAVRFCPDRTPLIGQRPNECT